MRIYFQKQTKYFLIIFISLFCFTEQAKAQFTITDNFRSSSVPGVVIGDNAKFTSGDEDPVNAGWLRLTSDGNDQKGYAYVNKSFPSTLGVVIDFEYTMWRTIADNTYHGADGISVFLFDAMYGPGNFSLGAYGGSLGYANSTQSTPPTNGVTGGYVGIGLDAYGNFARESEGKNGGSNDLSPNSIIMRGPTKGTTPGNSSTNAYLAGVTVLQNGNIVDALNSSGNAQHNVVDYNTVSSTRPTNQQFYRRVQLEIIPTGTGLYNIVVRWKTDINGAFVELMNYQTNEAPPALLKVGFAASTGGGYNNHEIRNILITTLGNMRVVKQADKDILHANAGTLSEIEYQIEVINDTPAELDEIDFTDKLTDANGDPLPNGIFDITSITTSGFLQNTVLPSPSAANPITTGEFDGTLHLAANTTGIITVKGKLNAIPEGNLLVNTASALPTTIVDEDLLNNTSVVQTPVVSENSDLVISNTVDNSCLSSSGNNFSLVVSNIGSEALQYGSRNQSTRLEVTMDLPSGVSISNLSHSGWTHSSSGNTHSFRRTSAGSLASGASLPPINYRLTSTIGSYINEVEVACSAESLTNRTNNTAEARVDPIPNPPTAVETIYYCLGDIAVPLEAVAESGNTLRWYLNEGGVVSNTPFTPNTSNPGTRTYYVSQAAPGGCESELTEITVIVLEETSAGSIGGAQEICSGTAPAPITSVQLGAGDALGTISYRWEYSVDEGQTWTTITGATQADYQPGVIDVSTSYRRITISTITGESYECESEPTNLVSIQVKDCKLISNPHIIQKTKD